MAHVAVNGTTILERFFYIKQAYTYTVKQERVE